MTNTDIKTPLDLLLTPVKDLGMSTQVNNTLNREFRAIYLAQLLACTMKDLKEPSIHGPQGLGTKGRQAITLALETKSNECGINLELGALSHLHNEITWLDNTGKDTDAHRAELRDILSYEPNVLTENQGFTQTGELAVTSYIKGLEEHQDTITPEFSRKVIASIQPEIQRVIHNGFTQALLKLKND